MHWWTVFNLFNYKFRTAYASLEAFYDEGLEIERAVFNTVNDEFFLAVYSDADIVYLTDKSWISDTDFLG